MRRLPGGRFRMGATGFYDDEGPVRAVTVDPFWMDRTPVTNAQFARFVAATGHITTAELPPDPANYPGMDPALAVPASIVFSPPAGPVDLDGSANWWAMVPGACWRWPLGPGSDLAGRDSHPVVHVTYADAAAYADWAGKALPTEAEWEFAARGGLDGATYAWGEELHPDGRRLAKTWEGDFPWRNAAPPGLERTSPVRSYPGNAYDLFDLIGNVWEWTVTRYDAPPDPAGAQCCGGVATTTAGAIRRVAKGGSHLCAPGYCQRYRPAARWPQPVDTSTSHMGFRCVIRADPSIRRAQVRS
jgi:formylglycine-generating enzyme required for sulfatase activity